MRWRAERRIAAGSPKTPRHSGPSRPAESRRLIVSGQRIAKTILTGKYEDREMVARYFEFQSMASRTARAVVA